MLRDKTPQSAAAKLYAGTIDVEELAAFERFTTALFVPAGTVLMRQGAFGNEAIVVLDGEVLVERDGKPVAIVGAGAALGEHALLVNEPRNATVTTATDCTIAVMSRSEFSTMLDRCPTIGRSILEVALARMSGA